MAVERGIFLNSALDESRIGLDPGSSQARRLHFLSTGIVKWRGRLDYELNLLLSKGLESLPPVCRAILRLALFEMRIVDIPDYAVVNAAVDMIRERGFENLTPLVNGLLRNAAREGEPSPPEEAIGKLAVESSHPRWLLERIEGAYGSSVVREFTEWNNKPAPLWVRVNAIRVSMPESRDRLDREGVKVLDNESPVPGYLLLEEGTVPSRLSGVSDGWLTVQDPSAGLAAMAAQPVEGMRVADLCAAPGGKSTHLAELGAGKAEINATDSDRERLKRLKDTVARHGATGLLVRPYKDVSSEKLLYDRVVIDAPCSNLGVLRRRADARWRISPDDLSRMADLQLNLLEKGGELVRPGGVLVYSTCTILPEENDVVVKRFLSHNTAFITQPLPSSIPEEFLIADGRAVSLPWDHGLDGAFVARMIRRKENR